MKILMLNWRDLKNPKSGGAEVLTEGILGQLATKHDITLFTASFPGSAAEEIVNGYRIIRKGSPLTVHFWALVLWYRQFKKAKFDVVIDQIHGLPFFSVLYVNTKLFAFIHEVAGDIWLRMYKFPFSWIGYVIEPFILRLYKNVKFITVSESTKQDLMRVKIPERNIEIIPEAIDDIFFNSQVSFPKEPDPTLIFLGRLAPMKRPEHVVEAYRIAKQKIPNLKLWMVGGGDYRVDDPGITFYGRVLQEKILELLSRATILVSASMKEGFGLVVIEAGAMGTPSIVYNVAGFRDSVKDGETGIICKDNSPSGMAEEIVRLINDKELYLNLRKNSIECSKRFTFGKSSSSFEQIIKQS